MGKILEQAIQKEYSSEPVKMKMLTSLQIWETQIKAGMSYLHLLKKPDIFILEKCGTTGTVMQCWGRETCRNKVDTLIQKVLS